MHINYMICSLRGFLHVKLFININRDIYIYVYVHIPIKFHQHFLFSTVYCSASLVTSTEVVCFHTTSRLKSSNCYVG